MLIASTLTLPSLTLPTLTLLFLGVVVGLGTALVWMIWQIEQSSKRRGNGGRFGSARPPNP